MSFVKTKSLFEFGKNESIRKYFSKPLMNSICYQYFLLYDLLISIQNDDSMVSVFFDKENRWEEEDQAGLYNALSVFYKGGICLFIVESWLLEICFR